MIGLIAEGDHFHFHVGEWLMRMRSSASGWETLTKGGTSPPDYTAET